MDKLLGFLFVSMTLYSCGGSDRQQENTKVSQTPSLNYILIGSFPHDINSFTEGFFVENGQIFESTGSPNELPSTLSHFGTLDTTSGKINVKASLDRNKYFGEGISIIDNKLFQLTYKAQTCFVYNAQTFELIKKVTYPNIEGWGLTNDGKSLIMSDGTYKLTYYNPSNFTKVKEMSISENGYAVDKINELEYVNGFIYANVWMTNTVLKIDANTGNVVAKSDLTNLYQDAKQLNPNLLEMNGIGYHAERGGVFDYRKNVAEGLSGQI